MTCEEERLVLTKVDASRATPDIRYSIRISGDMSWKAYVYIWVGDSQCELSCDSYTISSVNC